MRRNRLVNSNLVELPQSAIQNVVPSSSLNPSVHPEPTHPRGPFPPFSFAILGYNIRVPMFNPTPMSAILPSNYNVAGSSGSLPSSGVPERENILADQRERSESTLCSDSNPLVRSQNPVNQTHVEPDVEMQSGETSAENDLPEGDSSSSSDGSSSDSGLKKKLMGPAEGTSPAIMPVLMGPEETRVGKKSPINT